VLLAWPAVQLLRSRAALLVLLLLALYPLFRDLGGPLLWEDEGDTAAFARRIVATGLPTAWDGRTFLDSDYGFRVAPNALGHDFPMVGTPWLPFYVTAGSFALLGESATAARLPFALAALATLGLLHAFVLRATGSRRAALAAVLLLLASTQFLLYARECRSYALNMLFTMAVLCSFLRLGARRRDPWLAVAAVLLFHSQILPAAIALAACGVLALFHPRFRSHLPALLHRAPWVLAFTVPWLLLGWLAVETNWKPLESGFDLPARAAQLAVESMVAIPWLCWLVAIPRLWPRFREGDRDLLAIAGCYVLGVFALLPLTLAKDLILVVGLRYVCGLLPVAAAVTGLIVARASNGRPLRFAALLALVAATELAGNALPWLALGRSERLPLPGHPFVNVPAEPSAKLFNATWWEFVRGLGTPNPGTSSALVEFVDGAVGAEQVLVTNFGWDNLYFYTNRRQGFRISPHATAVRDAAKAAGLPAYVFGLDDARWLIWHPAADPLPDLPFEKVRATLEASGARLEPVARFRETIWENRPELHWHRFPGGRYFAPRQLDAEGRVYSDAVAYRIVRTSDAAP
jgi:4-amino-4-deoxy-L-arabinose transferase-like glycosyltransferase